MRVYDIVLILKLESYLGGGPLDGGGDAIMKVYYKYTTMIFHPHLYLPGS